jgi:hypothetical protein
MVIVTGKNEWNLRTRETGENKINTLASSDACKLIGQW